MGPIDALWHLLNLFGPAIGLALGVPTLAKWIWRRELAALPWRRLALRVALATAAATVAALLLLGRDGRMAGYGLMVLAAAVPPWWHLLRRA